MENDGPHNQAGEDDDGATANVVHFPRDWFGPREELVPFGPNAPEHGDAHASPPAGAVPSPVRADDFWGEASASIHDAMERPELREPAGDAARRSVWPVRSRRVRVPPVRLPRVRVPAVGLRALERRRALLLVGVVATGCLLVAAVVGSLWPAAVRTPQPGRNAAVLSPAVIGPAAPAIVFRHGARAARGQVRSARPKTRHVAPRHTASVSRARVNGGGESGAGGAGGSSASSSDVPANSAGDSVSAESSHASSTGSSATPTQASADSGGGGGGGSSQSSGPVGPGAPFGPGHFG